MPNVLMVDLNNFARYPTLATAYLLTPLRAAGLTVDVLSPLAIGAPPMEHEKEESWQEHLKRRVNFSTHPFMQKLHEPLRKAYSDWQSKPHAPTLKAVADWLDTHRPDVILLSAYLDHYPTVQTIAALAHTYSIPVLLGGPAFSTPNTIAQWLELDGVTAIFAGEADQIIVELVNDAALHKDLSVHTGVFTQGHKSPTVAPPLEDLDQLPIPDFDDFDWTAHPHRIIPVMTGRGCSWGVCTFCSDVTTANGRTYRSRSLSSVLDELKIQSERYQTKDFIFLDLKLNSNLEIWHGLIDNFQHVIPGGRWIGTVHVDGQGDHGLDAATLQAAAQSGLTRISFGLETASQKLARRMGKGTRVERNQQFVHDAYRAGLSVRCSMMLGYPGETSVDLALTREFLNRNSEALDRVRPARFKAIPGTRFEQLYHHRPGRFEGIEIVEWDYRYARAAYEYKPAVEPAYRSAKREILDLIHQINGKPLRDKAVQFDGLM